jgi:hypothetical protein
MWRKRLSVGLTTKEGQAVGGAERAWSHNTSDGGKAKPENRGDTIGAPSLATRASPSAERKADITKPVASPRNRQSMATHPLDT